MRALWRAMFFPESGVGLLRSLIGKFNAGVDPLDEADEPQSGAALAAAQAAIDEAIRQRRAEERRAAAANERRVSDASDYSGPERRSGERRRGAEFGRRTRD